VVILLTKLWRIDDHESAQKVLSPKGVIFDGQNCRTRENGKEEDFQLFRDWQQATK